MPDNIFVHMVRMALDMRQCCYSVKGFIDTYLPNLHRYLQSMSTGLPIDYKSKAYGVKEELFNAGMIDEDQLGGNGANPMMRFDAERIIASMPKGWNHNYMLKAYISVALACGARAVSMTNLRWRDIDITRSGNGQRDLLTLLFRVTKGGSTFHPVTLQGHFDNFGLVDPLWNLNKYCVEVHGVNIYDLNSVDNDGLDKFIFDHSTDAVSGYIRVASKSAGYPEDFFSSHSCRSGFLCDLIIAKYYRVGNVFGDADVLFLSGVIAGWRPGGSAQMRYVKNALKRVVVANFGSFEPLTGDPLADDLRSSVGPRTILATEKLNPKDFHLIDDPVPCWSLQSKVSKFVDWLGLLLDENNIKWKNKRRRVFDFAYSYCLAELFQSEHKELWEEYAHLRPSLAAHHILAVLCERDEHPFDAFRDTSLKIVESVAEYCKEIVNEEDLSKAAAKRFVQKTKRARDNEDEESSTIDSDEAFRIASDLLSSPFQRGFNEQGTRKRIPWTREEDRILCEEYLKVKDQMHPMLKVSTMLQRRSNDDCTNRFRVLKKQLDLDPNATKEDIANARLASLK